MFDRLLEARQGANKEEDMAIEAKDTIAHIRKGLMYSVRICFKSACDHPFVLGMMFFLLILYSCFPSLFAFLVSSSPVIICTTLLLGVLLSYGEPNLPEIEEDKVSREISSLKVGSATNDLVVKKDEMFTVEAHVDSRGEIIERTVTEASFGEGRVTPAGKDVSNVAFTIMHDGGDAKDDTFRAASSSFEEDDRDIHSKEKVIEERDVDNQGFVEKKEFSGENQAEGVLEMIKAVCGVSTKDQKEIKGLEGEIDKATFENHFDASLGFPCHPIDSHDASSDSESDRSESSSSDASMTDIIPMLYELHPLLDTEPQPALKSMDNSDTASGGSSQDNESDDGSATDEGEHQEEEEDEEAHEERDDGNEEAVKWTADDQKNLMDLGTSEMERNQRLENLIAKRRARKNLRYETEKNLIDLDSGDSVPTVEDLSRFLAQIPPISATRQNPFDLPYDSEETTGLPPIPGSAPSVLLPRRNPFDIPYDQVDQSGSLPTESLSQQEFVSVPQRDIFFRRHESFSLGASFSGELKQEKSDSRLRPYFVPERTEVTSFPTFQRQLGEKGYSKVSSVPESVMASSVIDQENHTQLLEEGLHQESDSKVGSVPASHDAEPVEPESQSSEEIDSVDVDHEQNQSGTNLGDDSETDLNTSIVTVDTHQAADAFRAVEEEIIEMGYDSPISDVANVEVIEDKYDGSSSSSSSEVNEKSSKMSTHEEYINPEPATGGSSKVSSKSMHLLHEDPPIVGTTGERVDDSQVTQVTDPVYDSSPSAVGKSHDEDFFYAGKRCSNSSSLSSDMADISEVTSPLRPPVEKNISSGDFESVNEDLGFASGGIWVAPPSLSAVDENESRSREISEIRERDVIQVGLPDVSEDFVKPIALAMPISVAGRIMHPSSMSAAEVESCEDSPVDVDATFHSDGIRPSHEASLEECQTDILKLAPISKVNLEDFNLEEEHESMIHPAGIVGLTGLQIIEEPGVGLSDIEPELSHLQRKSPDGTETVDSTKRLVHDSENDDAKYVSPITCSRDSGLAGVGLVESTEIPESNYAHAKGGAIKGIDEGLLSEVGAVGESRAEELEMDQGPEKDLQSDAALSVDNGADPLICPEKQDFTTPLQVSEARSMEDAELLSEANSANSEELHSVSEAIARETGSSHGHSNETSHGSETTAGVSASGGSTPRKTGEKD